MRKDRCPDKRLFVYKPTEMGWRPKRLTQQHEPDRTTKLLIKKLKEIQNEPKYESRIHNAAYLLGKVICVESRFGAEQFVNTLTMSYE